MPDRSDDAALTRGEFREFQTRLFAHLDARFDRVDARFDEVDVRCRDVCAQLESLAGNYERLRTEYHLIVEGLRRQTWRCIELTRRLRKLEESASHAWTNEQADLRAVGVRELMTEFSSEVTRQKLVDLRRHFIESFVRLARKEDLVSDAVIDERDFSVTLIDHRGNRLPKDRLSAGERQIGRQNRTFQG